MIVQRNRPTRPSIAGLRLAVGTLAVLAACCVPASAAGGAIKLFALPASLKSPDKIALGPDGALWFTQQDPNDKRAASALGRITTGGDVRAVTLPRGSRPRALTAGPDGALWYAAAGTDIGRLGRVTPAGVSELLLPGGLDSADGIVTGADGALWFTSGARVGRLVPGAAPTFIPVPDAESSLQRIIADPNGALWFTLDDTIRRITPAGALSTFRVPRRAIPSKAAISRSPQTARCGSPPTTTPGSDASPPTAASASTTCPTPLTSRARSPSDPTVRSGSSASSRSNGSPRVARSRASRCPARP